MTSRVCRTIRSSVPCKTAPRGGAMLSPLDKQQEHRLRPVECQQEDSCAKKGPPAAPCPRPRALTGVPGAWQHTLPTAPTLRNSSLFLSKERTDESRPACAPTLSSWTPFFVLTDHRALPHGPRFRPNAPDRIKRLRQDHLGLRPANLP